MIANHFGTQAIPRENVTPGDYVQHNGRTYIASANDIEKHRLFIRGFSESKCIRDSMIIVYLDSHGAPVKSGVL